MESEDLKITVWGNFLQVDTEPQGELTDEETNSEEDTFPEVSFFSI